MPCRKSRAGRLALVLGLVVPWLVGAQVVRLDPPETPAGYLSLLLINEVPFPGERGYRSVADSEAAMLALLWVLHSRLGAIPPGYRQEQVAAVRARSVIDVVTAPGQVEGFSRDAAGRPVTVPRVRERVGYLMQTANQGEPGKFARLLNRAAELARDYFRAQQPGGPDVFASLRRIGSDPVTGRGYSWMTDADSYHPGGNFVRIPDAQSGSLGGNRFFTLKQVAP